MCIRDRPCTHPATVSAGALRLITHNLYSKSKMCIRDRYNLTLKFEAVHYISGDNDTEENAYSQLEEDGTFTPGYVNDKEESVVIPEGSTEKIGRSAIGRRPVSYTHL